jgi:pyrroline-5-carboxylate reductase
MEISIIGAGAMGGSFAEGLLKTELFSRKDITIADPNMNTLDYFATKGVSVTNDNKVAVVDADIVAVVVKPWLVEGVLTEIKDTLEYSRQMLVIVAAGITSEQVNDWMAKEGKVLPYFLVIPNIAIAEKQSMTFIVPEGASTKETQKITDIFNELGGCLVTEERLLAAGTTLASCGIAYAMRYIRASVEGGVELGFKASDAEKIVLQTVKGAVELLQATGQHPESAIDMVTTPGGVTIRGLNEMEHAGFTSAVIRGLKAGL